MEIQIQQFPIAGLNTGSSSAVAITSPASATGTSGNCCLTRRLSTRRTPWESPGPGDGSHVDVRLHAAPERRRSPRCGALALPYTPYSDTGSLQSSRSRCLPPRLEGRWKTSRGHSEGAHRQHDPCLSPPAQELCPRLTDLPPDLQPARDTPRQQRQTEDCGTTVFHGRAGKAPGELRRWSTAESTAGVQRETRNGAVQNLLTSYGQRFRGSASFSATVVVNLCSLSGATYGSTEENRGCYGKTALEAGNRAWGSRLRL